MTEREISCSGSEDVQEERKRIRFCLTGLDLQNACVADELCLCTFEDYYMSRSLQNINNHIFRFVDMGS